MTTRLRNVPRGLFLENDDTQSRVNSDSNLSQNRLRQGDVKCGAARLIRRPKFAPRWFRTGHDRYPRGLCSGIRNAVHNITDNDHSRRITRRRSTPAFAFFLPDFRDGATKRSNDKIERRIFTCAPKSTERNYPRVGFAVLQATLQGLRPWTARSRFAEIEAGHEPLHWDAIRLLTASIPASSNSRSR
jgi:hypothetical protein